MILRCSDLNRFRAEVPHKYTQKPLKEAQHFYDINNERLRRGANKNLLSYKGSLTSKIA